jgi:hypothetical protein
MENTEYVTYSVCGYRYQGKISPGGDGSVLMPRKHRERVPEYSFYQLQKMNVDYCPGSFLPAKEYREGEKSD